MTYRPCLNEQARQNSLETRRRKMRERVVQFAEALAEHGDPVRASADLGIHPNTGRNLFALIRQDLGWQAS